MSKKSFKYMILKLKGMIDNFIMMRGLVKKSFLIIFVFFAFFLQTSVKTFAYEKIGIITDTILTPVNYYNAYFRTPEFFAQDIKTALYKKDVLVMPMDETRKALKNSGMTQNDFALLQAMQQGYDVDYGFLNKIAKRINVKKMIIVTMGMDIQRDFLKSTLWNTLNVAGMDSVNPTHRVSVYVGFFDVEKQNVLWETIYAKNIRNNKMKNLDTTISNNYEGMLRLKEYSKYISPDIAYNIKMKLINPNYVEPPTYITRENLKKYAKDRHNIGSKKELSEIERQKWDSEKFVNDSKENIKEKTNNAKEKVIETNEKIKGKYNNWKNKRQNSEIEWL